MLRLIYFIKVALGNMSQNLVFNMISAATISLALLILSAFLLLQVNLQYLLESTTQDLSISLYLADDLDDQTLNLLREEAEGLDGVSGVVHISKEQALSDLKKRLGREAYLLDELDENPLPASLELRLNPAVRTPERIKSLIKQLKSLSGVEQVNYAWEWADKLSVFIGFIKIGGMIVGGLLFLAVVFIIANTIRLTVMSRQDELYILRLMGATESFVRTPFIIEGMLQGLAGGLFALGWLFLLFRLLTANLELPFGFSLATLTFLPETWSVLVVVLGAVLGFIGSYVSLSRFMRA